MFAPAKPMVDYPNCSMSGPSRPRIGSSRPMNVMSRSGDRKCGLLTSGSDLFAGLRCVGVSASGSLTPNLKPAGTDLA